MDNQGEKNFFRKDESNLIHKCTQTDEVNPNLKKNGLVMPVHNLNLGVTSMEKNFQSFVMGKMLKDIEDRVDEQVKLMEKIQKEQEEERKQQIKIKLSEHIPAQLKNNGQSLEEILKSVHKLITYKNFNIEIKEEDLKLAQLKFLNEHVYSSLASHCTAAWLQTLNSSYLDNFSECVISNTSMWLAQIWKLKDAQVNFHEHLWDGFLSLCRRALVKKYPKYTVEGYQALYSKPPVIYLSCAVLPSLVQYLRINLGLPNSSFCLIPCRKSVENLGCIDISAWECLIESDLSVGKTPLLLMASAGSHSSGGVADNLQLLSSICQREQIWFHVEGYQLAQLALRNVPQALSDVISRTDSLSLDLENCLGFPALPCVTICHSCIDDRKIVYGLDSSIDGLAIFPIWFSMLSIGHDGIVERMHLSNQIIQRMHFLLNQVPNVQIVIPWDGMSPLLIFKYVATASSNYKVKNVVADAVKLPTCTDVILSSGASRAPHEALSNAALPSFKHFLLNDGASVMEEEEPEQLASNLNAFNQWLTDSLLLAVPQVAISAIEVLSRGCCLCFSSLDSSGGVSNRDSMEHLDLFHKALQENCSRLEATLEQRILFRKIISAQACLRLLSVEGWAGIGAVRYIPQCGQLTRKEEIAQLHHDLVAHLRPARDVLFSLAEASDGTGACVCVGLVTKTTDIFELLGLLISAARDVEQDMLFHARMAEMLRLGIENTQRVLDDEERNRLAQEGALRQVPFLDIVMNWWSPPPKDCRKGRSFNLASGEIQDTETTYKYRIQISSHASSFFSQEAADTVCVDTNPLK